MIKEDLFLPTAAQQVPVLMHGAVHFCSMSGPVVSRPAVEYHYEFSPRH